MERNEYLEMLSGFPNLFITSYEEIRGFKGDSLRIELKDGMKPPSETKAKKNGPRENASLTRGG